MNTYLARLLTAMTIVILLGIIGCSSPEEPQAAIEMDPIQVQTMPVATSTTTQGLAVSGNIQPAKEARISTRMMGYITAINAEVGDYVKKGQVLVNISNADLQAKLAQVKANIKQAEVAVQNAKKDFDRLTILFQKNSVTQKELDDITAQYNMAKAGLEAAQQMENEVNAQFKYSTIVAPFSGTVTAKYANSGDMANPGMPILVVAQTDQYQAVAMVPENQIRAIKKGQKASIWLKSLEKQLEGTVEEVAVSSSQTGGQFIVKIDLDKHKEQLYAGMYASIAFDQSGQDTTSQTVLVPESSLVSRGGLKGVYTVGQGDVAILRWLRLGRRQGNQYEVLSGLAAGDVLITSAQSRLYNGAPIVRR